MKTYQTFSTKKTPQSKPIPGSSQVLNNAGGYAFGVDKWANLDRFLVLGTEGGTYYVKEQTLTEQNAKSVIECIKENGVRVVDKIVAISLSGRAPKNDPALFALAMCAGLGDDKTRRAALRVLPDVARIGTHLFHFLAYAQQFRGWGRGLRNAVSKWYNDMDADRLAYQMVKYQQRDGWSHRDALRKAHPVAQDNLHNVLYHWATQGDVGDFAVNDVPIMLESALKAKKAESAKEIITLIDTYNIPREVIPTQFLNDPAVWEAMLPRMPMTAMIRNLGKMTSIGLFDNWSENTNTVLSKLNNTEILQKARIHPLSILVALKIYESGGGFRGSLTWNPNRAILDQLDRSFYLSFGTIEPSHKRTMLALDVSGSMGNPDIAGMPGITPMVGSAAMALVTASAESRYIITCFSSGGSNFMESSNGRGFYGRDGIGEFPISPRQRLDDVINRMYGMPFGGTDCALPMLYAKARELDIDTFVIYTDSETWHGNIHPVQALQDYRNKSSIPAKLVVVGMVSNGFSIADPNDAGMLDVVGFDTATPNLISEFSKGSLIQNE